MINKLFYLFTITVFMATTSCSQGNDSPKDNDKAMDTTAGSFGYDLLFLKRHDDSLIVLRDKSAEAKIIVSPKYQAKVFTSTAEGNAGLSFGWVNYKAFGDNLDAHMNAYGGENRFWLGPEGGKFSLFFAPQTKMDFEHWKTPAAFDSEAWQVMQKDESSVSLQKNMYLKNYAGALLDILVDRKISIIQPVDISNELGITLNDSVKAVAYQTENKITNTGEKPWTEQSGMPCIWILDMFKPSPSTVIVVPFKQTDEKDFDKVATTNYFGEIPVDRLKHNDRVLFLKADGKSRGKLGVVPDKVPDMIGSYDAGNKVLTILKFDIDSSAKYLNQEWNTVKPSFAGDAVNAYNDGPLADGSQMGPFYEMESVSPAAFLHPSQSLVHRHAVFHFTGSEEELNKIAEKLLGVSLQQIKQTF